MRVLVATSATVLVVGGAATTDLSSSSRTVHVPGHRLTIPSGHSVRVVDKTAESPAAVIAPGAHGGVSLSDQTGFGGVRAVRVMDETGGSRSRVPSIGSSGGSGGFYGDPLFGDSPSEVRIDTPFGSRTIDDDLGPFGNSGRSRSSSSRPSRTSGQNSSARSQRSRSSEGRTLTCKELAQMYNPDAVGFSEYTCNILMRGRNGSRPGNDFSDFTQSIIDRDRSAESTRGGRGVSYGRNPGAFRPFGENNRGSIFDDVNYRAPSGNIPFADPPRSGDFVLSSRIPTTNQRDHCNGRRTQPMFDSPVFGPYPGFLYCDVFGPVPTLSEYLPRGSDRI